MILTECEQTLFDLIRVALWNQCPQMHYDKLSEAVWTEIYNLSIKQGVCSVVFDGVCRLDSSVQPPADLLLTWAANTKLSEKRYQKINETIEKLDKVFKQEGIRMLLLKGRSISEYYPIPSHREYGDVDIYLGNDFEKGNSLLQIKGRYENSSPKHTLYIYNGTPIENHRYFVDKVAGKSGAAAKRRRVFEHVERELHLTLSEDRPCYINDILVPSPTFAYIFMLMHAGVHLSDELVVRHLCDWACFLYKNKDKYDEDRIETVISNLKFRQFSNLLTFAAIHYIGMPQEYAPRHYSGDINARLEARFIRSLFHRFPGANAVARNTPLCKWKRFYSKQWAFSLFYQEHLLERFVRTLNKWINKKNNINH